MKAKDAVVKLLALDEDRCNLKNTLKQLYVDEFKHRMRLRFGNQTKVETKQVIPLWKEMTNWAKIIIDATGIKVSIKDLDDEFKKIVKWEKENANK